MFLRTTTALGLRTDDQTDGFVALQGPQLSLAPTSVAAPRAVSAPPAVAPAGVRVARGRLGRPMADAWTRAVMVAADIAAAIVVLAVLAGTRGAGGDALLTFACAPLILLLSKLTGLYDRDRLRLASSTLDEVPSLLKLSGLFVLGLTILGPTVLNERVGGGIVVELWVVLLFALGCGRMAARSVIGRLSPPERCLVIGDVEHARVIHERLNAGRTGASVVAALPLTREDFADRTDLPRATEIRELVREMDAQRIIIAPSDASLGGVADVIRIAKTVGVRVSVVPGILDYVGPVIERDDINGLTLVGVRRFGLSSTSRLLKRSFDLVVASLGLLIVGPVMLLIAAAIRLDSKGPVLFRQVRVGRDGKHFQIVKFRSMVVDAEARKDELRSLSEGGEGLFKICNDPRITRVGTFLRRSSLDELPQILNVLRGEMSLVGPRPLIVEEDAAIVGLDRSRLHLMPGMTGAWQVLRKRVSKPEMIGIDYRYTADWSLWLDVKILVRTVLHVVRRGNS